MQKIIDFFRKYGLYLLAAATLVCLVAACFIYFLPDMYTGGRIVITYRYDPFTHVMIPNYVWNVDTWNGYEIIEGAAITYLVFIIIFLGAGIANIFIEYPDTKAMRITKIAVSATLPLLSLILVLASYGQIVAAI